MKLNFLGIPVENSLEKQNIICVRTVLFFERTCFQCNFASPLRFSAKQCISDVRIYVMENLV